MKLIVQAFPSKKTFTIELTVEEADMMYILH